MAQEFDPYRKWLGIPPDEQPADHYRLLGIVAFESDPDVVSNAADRQMTHIRTFQSGKHSELSQRILNELSAARLCLLNDERRAEYDEKLRAEQALATPVPPPAAPPVPRPSSWLTNGDTGFPPVVSIAGETPPDDSPLASGIPNVSTGTLGTTSYTRRRKRASSQRRAIMAIIAGLLLVAALVAWLLYRPAIETWFNEWQSTVADEDSSGAT